MNFLPMEAFSSLLGLKLLETAGHTSFIFVWLSAPGWEGKQALALGKGLVLKVKDGFSSPSLCVCCFLYLDHSLHSSSNITNATSSRRLAWFPQVGLHVFSAPPQPLSVTSSHLSQHPYFV